MFSKVTLFIAAAFVASAVAGAPEAKCNTGPVQCCQQLHKADSKSGAALLSLVGAAVQDVTLQVGANCSPITIVGAVGGSKCSTTPVCCSKNNINGLVSIGCSPIGV